MFFALHYLLTLIFRNLSKRTLRQGNRTNRLHTRKSQSKPCQPKTVYYHRQPKPQWVIDEVIKLAALYPNAGCRTLALQFNRLYERKRQMTVSKSYIAYTLKRYRYTIACKRRDIRRKQARIFPTHQCWSMDISYIKDQKQITRILLSIMDNGSRYSLLLETIPNKSSWLIIKMLCTVLWHYGKPKTLKTDNEACFTSMTFCSVLRLLGIKHKRSEKYCPWQNGHIERLFGTLKTALKSYSLSSCHAKRDLAQFQFWYNHCRPHQNLKGKTPAEQHYTLQNKLTDNIAFLSFWDNTLSGFYLAPD